MAIYFESNNIILENDYLKISVSSKNSLVQSVFDKRAEKEIKGEDTYFFSFVKNDKKTAIFPDSVTLDGNVITVKCSCGEIKYEINTENDYFTIELVTVLPDGIYKAIMANVKYDYDYSDKENIGAAGIAVTYWANP